MPATAITGDRLAEFAAGLAGEVLAPGDAGYDERRRIHNG